MSNTPETEVKHLRACFVNNTEFCYCRGTACEHNPINMTNETEVLRIEGNVTVPKGSSFDFMDAFYLQMKDRDCSFSGSIVPQDSPTGMRLYRVEDIENLRKENTYLNKSLLELTETKQANQDEFLSLSEELAQDRERSKRGDKALELLDVMYESQKQTIAELRFRLRALNNRLENKENTRWRTFIKWWKELW
jgi:hypothetical protein